MPTTYKILSNIPLSRFIPYAETIIGDHQGGFQRNRSTIDHIFCIHQILEKNWVYNEAVHQLFIDFKKAYDSVRRKTLYPSRRCLHFVVVGGLVWSKDSESCAGGSFATGRVSHAGLVEGDDTD
jgi:hypothetical protein